MTGAEDWPPEIPPRKMMGEVPVAEGGEAEFAAHLLYEASDDFRWATDLGCWIVRDGWRWVRAPRGVKDIITECLAMTTPDRACGQPAIQKWARQNLHRSDYGQSYDIGTSRGIVSHSLDDVRVWNLYQAVSTPAGQERVAALMRNLAGSDNGDMAPLTVRTDELDAEPHIFWAGSVPFDLVKSADGPAWATETYSYGGAERWPMTCPHLLGSAYCPDMAVETPLWDKLLAAVFPDEAERDHALDALAHGLHGYPTATAMLARSATGTGKSLIATLISDLLGSYAGQVAAPTLFGRSGSSQFAHDEMGGARFVVMTEGKKASFETTEAFKAVVSPDPLVNARGRLEKRRRLVAARHTLFLTVNPAADLDYSDPAVVRRLVPLGFRGDPADITALSAQIGTDSAGGYANWQAEAPGVLAQLMVRCARVLADIKNVGTRADLPASIAERFAAVVAEAHPFGRWMTERTASGGRTATGDLLADYQGWCEANRVPVMNATWFGRALASAGVERAKLDRSTRGWEIALRS